MFHRIRRRAAQPIEAERRFFELSARLQNQVPPGIGGTPTGPECSEPATVVDDFLPPELRVPSHDQLAGQMMQWKQPLVLDGEMVACVECGTYRDWLVIAMRGEIWLRCRESHQQPETRLDVAWYNRHAAPMDAVHATFEDCVRHLGH
ncbi:hypothetical protein [Streptomyces sp. NPDC059928]|uniref:hypothetical protein n=1 Tax=unclassified Streptomyces TaxID=2593676 RepID=UPI00365A70B0